MVGQLVNKKLPKYKFDNMKTIARLVKNGIGDNLSLESYKGLYFTYQGNTLTISNHPYSTTVLVIVLGGDSHFPRISKYINKDLPAINSGFSFTVARRIRKLLYELVNGTLISKTTDENLLSIEFCVDSKFLLVIGSRGTRYVYKG